MTPEERAEKARVKTREWFKKPGNRERNAVSKAAWRKANPEAIRSYQQRYRDMNRAALRANRVAKYVELRSLILAAYGAVCNCPGCHVHHVELLTVDHVNGDGAQHRQRLKSRSTLNIYRDIIRSGFPDSYQVLCGSCNFAKSNRAACPLAGQEH